jgi:hypothetical protein
MIERSLVSLEEDAKRIETSIEHSLAKTSESVSTAVKLQVDRAVHQVEATMVGEGGGGGTGGGGGASVFLGAAGGAGSSFGAGCDLGPLSRAFLSKGGFSRVRLSFEEFKCLALDSQPLVRRCFVDDKRN